MNPPPWPVFDDGELERFCATLATAPGLRSSLPLADFVEFCLRHPELRFWQALSVWVGRDVLLAHHGAAWENPALEGALRGGAFSDPFYREGKYR